MMEGGGPLFAPTVVLLIPPGGEIHIPLGLPFHFNEWECWNNKQLHSSICLPLLLSFLVLPPSLPQTVVSFNRYLCLEPPMDELEFACALSFLINSSSKVTLT